MWMYRCSNFKLDHKYNYAIFIDTLCELKTNLNEKHWPLGLHSVYQSHLYMTLSVFFSNFFCHCRLFIIFGMLICSFSMHLERVDINYTSTMRARLICNALDQMEFWANGGNTRLESRKPHNGSGAAQSSSLRFQSNWPMPTKKFRRQSHIGISTTKT